MMMYPEKLNGEIKSLEALGDFLASVNRDIVLRVSRFFPRYRMRKPVTGIEDLKREYHLLKKKLRHVYIGNISSEEIADINAY